MPLIKQSDTILQNALTADYKIAYAGVRVQAFADDVEQQLYDSNGDPVSSVETNANGLYEFWIEEGDYELRYSLNGSPLGAQDYALYSAARAVDLASTASGKGAALIGVEGGGTVQESILRSFDSFTSRAAAADWIDTYSPADGRVFMVAGFFYITNAADTRYSDIPGASPFGPDTPHHWGCPLLDYTLDQQTQIDAAPDCTPYIQDMLDYATGVLAGTEKELRFERVMYTVTSLSIINATRLSIEWDGAVFYGRAATDTHALLHIHNVSRSNFVGRVRVSSDFARATPTWSTNYQSAIRITSNTTGDAGSPYSVYTQPSSFLNFDPVQLTGFKRGVVSGYNEDAVTPHHREGQDHITFNGLETRSCLKPIYQNVDNAGILLRDCNLVPQQFSASASWWDDTVSWLVRNDNGRLSVQGGWLQKGVATGWGIYGKDIFLANPVFECSAPNYVTGDVQISGLERGYCDGLTTALFTAASGAVGTLRIEGSQFRRISMADYDANTDGGRVDRLFMDMKDAPGYVLDLSDSILWQFYFDPISGSKTGQFVRGGKLLVENVDLRNAGATHSDYHFLGYPFDITTSDVSGLSMAATADLTAKGGWTATALTGGHFAKTTTDAPPGCATAIVVESVGATGAIFTPATTSAPLVRQSTDYLLTMDYKQVSGSGYCFITVQYYDFAGSTIGAAVEIYRRTAAELTTDGLLTGGKVHIPMKTPAGAYRARIIINATNSAVRFAFANLSGGSL